MSVKQYIVAQIVIASVVCSILAAIENPNIVGFLIGWAIGTGSLIPIVSLRAEARQ